MTQKRSFLSSVGALAIARALAMASQILILPVLARYLSPGEFGLAALAMSVAILANMLSDGGMGRSLIRTPLDRQVEWSSVFWFLTALGLGLSLAVLALTPAMVWLFDEPDLFNPLMALSVMPLILSLGAAFSAEMEQRDAFRELAVAQTAATAIGLLAAVWMALTGWGVWALIVQQLLLAGVRMIWVVWRARFRPGMTFSRRALGSHFTFGRDTTAASMLGYLREQSAPLIIGKVLGTADLGIFAMTARFMRLPMFALAGPVGQVLYVRLTRSQEDPVAFRGIVLAATRLLGLLILPPMMALAMVSDTLFTLLLSERWAEVGPVFALVAGGAALTAITNPTVVALTALGHTLQRLRLTAEITLLWLVMLVGSVSFGLAAVAAARTLWMLIQLPRHWAYLGAACGITARDFLMALLPGVALSGGVMALIGVAALALPVTDLPVTDLPVTDLAVSPPAATDPASTGSAVAGWTWLLLAGGLLAAALAATGWFARAALMRDLAKLKD